MHTVFLEDGFTLQIKGRLCKAVRSTPEAKESLVSQGGDSVSAEGALAFTLLGPCPKAFRVAKRRSNIASPWCLGFPACFLTTSCGILDKRLQGVTLVF